MFGFSVEKYAGTLAMNDDNFLVVRSNRLITLRIYGNLKNIEKLALTDHQNSCYHLIGSEVSNIKKITNMMALIELKIPATVNFFTKIYICTYEAGNWTHLGNDKHLSLIIEKEILPFWLNIIIMCCCIVVSSLCNGLTVGIITLDITELNIYKRGGTLHQQTYATNILPIRVQANYLLVTMLLMTTISNTLFTIFTEYYLRTWMAVITVTIIILLFTEILPSTVFTRYALTLAGKLVCFPWTLMYLTFPITYPLAKLLDKILGQDIAKYTKARLKEVLEITADMPKQLKDIITGTIDISNKKVEDIMTQISDIYMLPITTLLDYSTIAEITGSGYSRIPIYDTDRRNVVSLIFTKDLALLDPEDRIPVRALVKLTKLELLCIEAGTTLDAVFNIFKEDPLKRHLALIYDNEETEYARNVIGLITLEDLIEELVQFEIVDEFDTIVDNRSKRRRDKLRMATYFSSLYAKNSLAKKFDTISPQLRMATHQYLTSALDKFHPDILSSKILWKMLEQDVIFNYKPNIPGQNVAPHKVFSERVCSNSFIMIIEGRVEVLISEEKIKCENGPFFYFGLTNLDPNLVYERQNVKELVNVRK